MSSRLDYANSIMYGMSKSLTAKLERRQNMLARVVLQTNNNNNNNTGRLTCKASQGSDSDASGRRVVT